ncbi:TonB-dependent receptor [Altererythrobacter sp. CC-YST694]|uniref:TonB-dependent receptor n=1 Tax=Altererythrobacter sp. CC-YST694 TaxID=2755038 RepID=UPI001D030798|nr:TonB-dependent receptor [Altererythrobacter sp. CC-YST694]MCB5426394.1 TonB-dependent receptor [Altererythrobacter sp. CC-YST694]
MKNNRLRVRLLGQVGTAIAMGLVSSAAYAEATDATAEASSHEIIVLGTSRQDVTALQSTAPVDIFNADTLEKTGARTLNQALEKLSPSFNFPQGQNSWNGQNTRSASLKGISPAYTLILVDGKRRNASSQITTTLPFPASTSVDINTIPLSAIQRVELLHDGAASRYGSDAIAGVVNVVLRDEADGGGVSGTLGGHTDGGGFTRIIDGWHGFGLGEGGSLTISANYTKIAITDRSEPDWRPLFLPGDPRNDTFDKKWAQWGSGWSESAKALAKIEQPIGDDVRLYGYVNYSYRKSGSYVNPERVVSTTINPITLETLTIAPSTRAVLDLYPDGYTPRSKSNAKDFAAVGGISFGDQSEGGKFDLSASYGQNEAGKWTLGTVNPSWGADSKTDFYWGSTKSRQLTLQADYVRDFEIGLHSPVVLSAGALYRHEYWGTGDLADVDAYTNGGLANPKNSIPVVAASVDSPIRPEDEGSFKRNVKGAYAGLEADLVRGLTLGITGRYEHYSDFGSTWNGEATARYDLTDWLAVRGTFGTGFHAPSLAMLGTQVTGYTSTWSNTGLALASPGQTRLFRPNDPLGAPFGAKPLDPEKSRTLTAGIVLQPDSSSSLTVDLYKLKVEDAVVITDALRGSAISQLFTVNGLPGFTQASYYFNGWDSTTKGIDIVAKKRFDDIAGGRVSLSLAASFNDVELSNVRNKLEVNGSTFTVIDPYRVRDAQRGTPGHKFIFDLNYDYDAFSANLSVKHYGAYWYNASAAGLSPGGNGNRDQRFSPETYVDLALSYQLLGNLRLTAGAQNVFNKYPDKYVQGNRSNGVNAYGFIHPNGASGRFVYGGVSLDF